MKQPKHPSPQLHSAETDPNQLLHDVIVQTPQRPARADGIALGTFDGIADDGRPMVSIPTFGLSGIHARTISPLDENCIGQQLALGFEGGDPRYPIILGVMMPSPASLPTMKTEAVLDGEKIVLTAEHEIELRCGEAALILSADGRIQLRGTYITSHASATQRILGGSVNIN